MKTAKKNTEIYDEVRSKFDPTFRCPGDHGFECLNFLPQASDAIKMHSSLIYHQAETLFMGSLFNTM